MRELKTIKEELDKISLIESITENVDTRNALLEDENSMNKSSVDDFLSLVHSIADGSSEDAQ